MWLVSLARTREALALIQARAIRLDDHDRSGARRPSHPPLPQRPRFSDTGSTRFALTRLLVVKRFFQDYKQLEGSA